MARLELTSKPDISKGCSSAFADASLCNGQWLLYKTFWTSPFACAAETSLEAASITQREYKNSASQAELELVQNKGIPWLTNGL
ncbi:MAG: hypothetical protein ACKVN9_06145 [Methylophilaceae bacterium]